jgi:hypothetical protein
MGFQLEAGGPPGTAKKFKDWQDAEQRLRDAERERTSAQNALRHAQQDLAKNLMIPEAQPGEKFCVWCGGSLVEVTVGALEHSVRVRTQLKGVAA